MKHKFVFANNNFYRKWSNQRDEACEHLLDRTKQKSTAITDKAFIRVIEIVHARYATLSDHGIPSQHRITEMQFAINEVFHGAAQDIVHHAMILRRRAWMLAHVAEAVAVASIAKKEKPVLKASPHDVQRQDSIDPKLFYRVFHIFMKLRDRITHTVTKSVIQEEPLSVAIGRVFKVLPKRETMNSVRKLKRLTKVKEAAAPRDLEDQGPSALMLGKNGQLMDWNFDPETWSKIQQEYNDESIPVDRSPANVFDINDPFTDQKITDDIAPGDAVYGWEVEQETTHDFVQAVRSGEVSAAKENGVDDFMWVAILDKKTCEQCCEWRDGLTSQEIAEKLDEDASLGDYCDAVVPPAHFNCRCKVAPVSDSLGDYEPDTDVELDGWLNSLN